MCGSVVGVAVMIIEEVAREVEPSLLDAMAVEQIALTWAPAVLLPLLVLLAVVVWASAGTGRQRLRRCGEQIPGPRPLPIIGNLREVGLDSKKILEKMIIVNEKYGSTFRMWMGPFNLFVALGDPSDIEALLSKSKNLKKAFNYDFLHSWLGLGLLTSTGERWKKHRKIITPTFHFSILEQFVDVFNKQGNILMSILKKKEGEEPFDIAPHIDLYTQDVICETAMGVQLNAQTEGYASSYLQSVKSMCELLMKRSSKPWLYLDFIYRLTHLGWQESNNLKILHGMTNEVIRRRRKQLEEDPTLFEKNIDEIGRKRKLAFLDLLLYSSLNGDVLSDEDIREEVDTFMFEGHDTTASAISFALYELSRRPDIQERILDELREVVSDGKLEELSLNLEDLNKLKYLEQVIKETLRLYPSVPVFGRQTTEDLHLPSISVDVPPNATVVVIPMLLHRNPELYPNPREFNPDNFLLEAVSKRHPYAYVPFSAGSRNCIGQKFAMLEMKAVLAKIVWNYSLQIDPTFEIKLVPEITLKAENGVRLSVVRRINT